MCTKYFTAKQLAEFRKLGLLTLHTPSYRRQYEKVKAIFDRVYPPNDPGFRTNVFFNLVKGEDCFAEQVNPGTCRRHAKRGSDDAHACG